MFVTDKREYTYRNFILFRDVRKENYETKQRRIYCKN